MYRFYKIWWLAMPNLTTSGKAQIDPQVAVTRFLKDMATAAKRTFPTWQETLIAGIEECPLQYDEKRAVLDIHPMDDYYFAGAVALETSKVRELFDDYDSHKILGLIGGDVDGVSGRSDRIVSDLVFKILAQVDLTVNSRNQKKPYDQVVKGLLMHIGVDKIDSTRHLMSDALFRHTLGEPLALGIPHWWHTFQSKYAFREEQEAIQVEDSPRPLQTVSRDVRPASPRRKPPRRAVAF
jgi:hypothetical protein